MSHISRLQKHVPLAVPAKFVCAAAGSPAIYWTAVHADWGESVTETAGRACWMRCALCIQSVRLLPVGPAIRWVYALVHW